MVIRLRAFKVGDILSSFDRKSRLRPFLSLRFNSSEASMDVFADLVCDSLMLFGNPPGVRAVIIVGEPDEPAPRDYYSELYELLNVKFMEVWPADECERLDPPVDPDSPPEWLKDTGEEGLVTGRYVQVFAPRTEFAWEMWVQKPISPV